MRALIKKFNFQDIPHKIINYPKKLEISQYFSNFFKFNHLPKNMLGRWKFDDNQKIIARSIRSSNDHCGVCQIKEIEKK